MNEERLRTAGSRSTTLASACCRSAIAGNETDWSASDTPRIRPVSCTGKKPLGTTKKSATVAASVAPATSNVAV